jgi:hypothetical protein
MLHGSSSHVDGVAVPKGVLGASPATLVADHSPGVLVRTPTPERLAEVLAPLGATLRPGPDGEYHVFGSDVATVGHEAWKAHVELHELSPARSDLEQVFLELTGGNGGGGAGDGGTSDGRQAAMAEGAPDEPTCPRGAAQGVHHQAVVGHAAGRRGVHQDRRGGDAGRRRRPRIGSRSDHRPTDAAQRVRLRRSSADLRPGGRHHRYHHRVPALHQPADVPVRTAPGPGDPRQAGRLRRGSGCSTRSCASASR